MSNASSIDWPAGWERTPAGERTAARKFQATLASTTAALETELDRLDPEQWRVSTASGGAHTKATGLPKHSANPEDPGMVVRWRNDGEQFAVACDAYTRLQDNARAVYLWVHETRMRGQRPVRTGDSQFAAARLPSPDEEPAVTEAPPHDVLGVAPDAPPGVVRAAARAQIKETHPDQGGTREELARVQRAKAAMLEDSS